jgi:predicted Rossmann fold flavoprotein
MKNNTYDVAVIGAGPAGMIAAGISAKNGANVILIEKNEKPGKKLLITGKGRCNLTHAEYDKSRFIEAFGKKGKFLYPALNAFGIEDTLRFFSDIGLKIKVERGNRVFPESDRASEVLAVLLKFLRETGVLVLGNSKVKRLKTFERKIKKIITTDNEILASKVILCTGGLSFPGTGSTGDGMNWAKELGHTILEPKPALVPLKVEENWIEELRDLTLKNVRITLQQDNKKIDEGFGEAIFYRDCIGGPIILDMSKRVGEILQKAPVKICIDLKPALSHPTLDARILREIAKQSNKVFRNSLGALLPQKLIPVIVRLSGISPSKKMHAITKEERKRLLNLLKELSFHVTSLTGFDKSIVTTGGISLKEIDSRTMGSKNINNLYLAGEIIDLDGPTGGYNLQVCWSTGYLAGIQ